MSDKVKKMLVLISLLYMVALCVFNYHIFSASYYKFKANKVQEKNENTLSNEDKVVMRSEQSSFYEAIKSDIYSKSYKQIYDMYMVNNAMKAKYATYQDFEKEFDNINVSGIYVKSKTDRIIQNDFIESTYNIVVEQTKAKINPDLNISAVVSNESDGHDRLITLKVLEKCPSVYSITEFQIQVVGVE